MLLMASVEVAMIERHLNESIVCKLMITAKMPFRDYCLQALQVHHEANYTDSHSFKQLYS